MDFKRRLPIPKEVKALYPLSKTGENRRKLCIEGISGILEGKDSRLLLIIGPCSADREDAVLEYLSRLKSISEKVQDKILIVPRLYTSKPRSQGNAYMGMLHRPNPESETDDVFKGLLAMRDIHKKALEDIGLGCADEMLYPDTYRFLSDILCYVTIGARSADDQQHKLLASGIDIPVGIKNPLNGDIDSLLKTINTAQNSHTFIYRNWEVESRGNKLAHGILRGYVDHMGHNHSNSDPDTIDKICRLYDNVELKNPSLIVDCNHSNSGKDYLKQIDIAKKIAEYHNTNPITERIVKGLMIESYIKDGRQDENGGEYGKSITDPCLGLEKTERLIYDLAEIW